MQIAPPIHGESKTVWPVTDEAGDCIATVAIGQTYSSLCGNRYRVVEVDQLRGYLFVVCGGDRYRFHISSVIPSERCLGMTLVT